MIPCRQYKYRSNGIYQNIEKGWRVVAVMFCAYYLVLAATIVAFFHFATAIFFCVAGKANAMVLTAAIMK